MDYISDVKSTVNKRSELSFQTSTVLLQLAEAGFASLARKWGSRRSVHRFHAFSGYVDHVSNVHRLLSIGFISQQLQQVLPPMESSVKRRNGFLPQQPGRFKPYGTETILFPLVIYMTIWVLLLILVVHIINKKNGIP